ncbi:hypothetical protein LCGC14_2670090 [marine sediment metagenome]|uniref:Uncharacterized protein n=1 Tax=marine sediment metagenome TaxID=412755 RepID=A0A0F9BZB2_9ZZZZ
MSEWATTEDGEELTFELLILDILYDNSGGMKMTALIVDIIARVKELSEAGTPIAEFAGFVDALNRKLEEMEVAGKLCLLHYGHPMGGGSVREKIFVYFPLAGMKKEK